MAKMRVSPLARYTGTLLLAIPKISHMRVPKVNRLYMTRDMEDVSFVRMVCIACGIKDTDVQHAASNPAYSIQ